MDTIKILLGLLFILSLSANKVNAQDDDITNPIIIPDVTEINPLYSFDAKDPIHPFLAVDLNSARYRMTNFGDINGDALPDIGFLFWDAFDERQSPPTIVNKTIIYYGNSSTKEGNLHYYDLLYPLGDLDNDGFADAVKVSRYKGNSEDVIKTIVKGSESGFIDTDRIITGLSTPETYFNFNIDDFIITSIDLNSDGLNETIQFRSNLITTIWGNQELKEITWTNQSLTDFYIDNSQSFSLYDFDKDSLPEIVFYNRFSQSSGITVFTYNFEKASFEQYQNTSIKLELLVDTFDFGDFNGDNQPELGVFSTKTGNRFYSYDSTTKLIDVENPTTLNTYYYKPIGDINGDSISDLAFYDTVDSVYAIGLGKNGVLNDFTADIPLTRDELIAISSKTVTYKSLTTNGNFLISVNSPFYTTSTYSLSFEEDDRFFLKTQSANTLTNQLVTLSDIHLTGNDLNNTDRIFATQNLGDLNNDGIEDFGIVYSDRGELQIHYGGQLSEIPDIILSLKSNIEDKNRYMIHAGAVSADFNGDGFLDIIMSSNQHTFIKIFFGSESGPDATADLQLDYFAEIGNIYSMDSLGDINSDGFDDIIVSTYRFRQIDNKYPESGFVQIIYGAATESDISAFDIAIDNQKTYSPVYFNEITVKNIGDYNGDSVPDFALASKYFYDFTNTEATGALLIYHGKGEKTAYSSYNKLLFYPDQVNHFSEFFAAGKDFNGDNKPDLAVGIGDTRNKTKRVANLYLNQTGVPDSVFIQQSIVSQNSSSSVFLKSLSGSLHFIDDINNDSMDELLFTTGYEFYHVGGFGFSKAGIIMGKNSDVKYHLPEIVFKAPNPLFGLGGAYNVAVGDFDGDEETVEFIFPQEEGSLKGYRTGNWHVYQLNKTMLSSIDEEFEVKKVELFQNYPNPFNPSTQIKYNLPKSSSVSINIYNSLGQLIAKPLSKSQRNAGVHTLDFNGSKLASGVYFYELLSDEIKMVKSMILIK